MKISSLAVAIENSHHERIFSSFCKQNEIKKFTIKNMDVKKIYYYIFCFPPIEGQPLTTYPIQEGEELLIENGITGISVNRFMEVYAKCERR